MHVFVGHLPVDIKTLQHRLGEVTESELSSYEYNETTEVIARAVERRALEYVDQEMARRQPMRGFSEDSSGVQFE